MPRSRYAREHDCGKWLDQGPVFGFQIGKLSFGNRDLVKLVEEIMKRAQSFSAPSGVSAFSVAFRESASCPTRPLICQKVLIEVTFSSMLLTCPLRPLDGLSSLAPC